MACPCQFCRYDGDGECFPVPVRFRTFEDNVGFTAWYVRDGVLQNKWTDEVCTYATTQEVVLAAAEHLGLAMDADTAWLVSQDAELPRGNGAECRWLAGAALRHGSGEPTFGTVLCQFYSQKSVLAFLEPQEEGAQPPGAPSACRTPPPRRGRKRARIEEVHAPLADDHPNFSVLQELMNDADQVWNAEFIVQLLELGATPELVAHRASLTGTTHGGPALLCRFRTPRGEETEELLLPRGIIASIYGLRQKD